MKTSSGLLLVVSVLLSPVLMAQTVVRAELSGEYEVPGIATNATGEAVFVVYPDRIEYVLTARDLGTEISASHIRLGPRGVNGPVLATLFLWTAHGAFTGKIIGTILPVDLVPAKERGVGTFSDLSKALIEGRTYTNVHTRLAPAGEIRGQNLAVPVE